MRPPFVAVAMLATPIALLLRPPPPQVVEARTTVIAIPEPIVVRIDPDPPTDPDPPAEVPAIACPPPRTDAPRLRPPILPEPIEKVVASTTNAGWLAAYNDDHVFVSTNAGKSFERVLDGAGAVYDVGFDCFGRTIVVRDGHVGIRNGSEERWRPLRGIELGGERIEEETIAPIVKVIGGGPHVAIVGRDDMRARVAISRDLGATWGYHDLHPYFEGVALGARQLPDGALDIALEITDCDSYEIQWTKIANGRVAQKLMPGAGSSLAFAGARLFAGDRWRTWSSPATYDGWKRLDGLDGGSVVAGPTVALVDDGGAYRVVRGRLAKLPVVVRGTSPTLDAAGRLWTVHCEQLHVATRVEPAACGS